MNYYITVNEKEKKINILDEDCFFEFIDKKNEKVVGIFDENNHEKALLMAYRLRPDLEFPFPDFLPK